MADEKFSQLPAATTPLTGTEIAAIVQSGVTDQVTVANLTAGRSVSAASLTLTTTPLAATSGGTGAGSAFTSGGIAYASSTSVLATGSALTFSGGNFATTGSATAASFIPSGSTVPTNGLYLSAANTLAWATNSGVRMTLDGSGNLSGISRLGVGGGVATPYQIQLSGSIAGATTSYGIAVESTVQSGVTSSGIGFNTNLGVQNASFTLGGLYHFLALQGTKGASATVTNQYGFFVDASLTAATNNYGFYGNIASGSNRWNLYMNGTASNYMAGSLGLGTTSLTGYSFRNSKNITGATTSYANRADGAIQSDVTAMAVMWGSAPTTQSASFTCADLRHVNINPVAINGSSAVTEQYGVIVNNDFRGATANYAYYAGNSSAITAGKTYYAFRSDGNIATGGGTAWNLYIAGTAPNHFSGNVLIFGAGKLGYTTGSGGAVTQATSRTTGVTLDKTNGAITLVSAAGTASWQSFTVTNSTVAATDVIRVCQKSGTDKYMIFVTAVGAGSFEISFATTGGTTTEQPVFNFSVVGAVAA